MSGWDAIVAVNYSDSEEKIIEESESLGGELEELMNQWRSEREDRGPHTLSNVHCIAKEECAEDLEGVIE